MGVGALIWRLYDAGYGAMVGEKPAAMGGFDAGKDEVFSAEPPNAYLLSAYLPSKQFV